MDNIERQSYLNNLIQAVALIVRHASGGVNQRLPWGPLVGRFRVFQGRIRLVIYYHQQGSKEVIDMPVEQFLKNADALNY